MRRRLTAAIRSAKVPTLSGIILTTLMATLLVIYDPRAGLVMLLVLAALARK